MTKIDMILTREQLIHELEEILHWHFQDKVPAHEAAVELCDLIADLPNQCFHSNEKDVQ